MKEIIALIIVLIIFYLIFKWLISTTWGFILVILGIIGTVIYFKNKKKKKTDAPSSESTQHEEPVKDKQTEEVISAISQTKDELQPKDKNTRKVSEPMATFTLDGIKCSEAFENRRNHPQTYRPSTVPKNYVVIDTETTGLSVQKDRIVQLAAMKFIDDKLVDTFNEYINPEGVKMSEGARLTTGIVDEDLIDKPTFSEIIPKFQEFVGDFVWIGHNINRFDVPIIFYNGYRQKDKYTSNLFSTIDTYLMARNEMEGIDIPNYKLTTLKNYFNLSGKSHDALGDCEVTAEVYRKLRDGNLTPGKVDTDNLLSGLRFCITGAFKEASRAEIKRMIELHGGKVTGSVSHLTNYLLSGRQVSSKLKEGKSSSLRKAEEYGTKIINYQDLMKMLASQAEINKDDDAV